MRTSVSPRQAALLESASAAACLVPIPFKNPTFRRRRSGFSLD
ncbi:MAG: hypothetical protein ABSG84_08525 [Acidobacteriaceae bacterium]